jgi:glycosyltransferase involved in cell wall biosynthesis
MQVQTLNLFNYLASRGHTCRVLAFFRDGESIDLNGLQEAMPGVEVVGLFPRRYNYAVQTAFALMRKRFCAFRFSPKQRTEDYFCRSLSEVLRETDVDLVHLEGIAMAPYLELVDARPSVLSSIDASSLRQRRLAAESTNIRERLYRLALSHASSLLERSALPRATKVHVVSPVDSQYLRESVPGIDVEDIGIAVPDDLLEYVPKKDLNEMDKSHRLLFSGDLRVGYINRGLAWFLSCVYPEVQRMYPDTRLTILGRGSPSSEVAGLLAMTPSAEVLSWVEDYYAEILKSQVVVLPDPTGTGLKNRTLQAMALGRPVVGTPSIFEGIPMINGVHGFSSATADGFAQAIVDLLGSQDMRQKIGCNARSFVLEWYTVESVGRQWLNLYSRAMTKFATRNRHDSDVVLQAGEGPIT